MISNLHGSHPGEALRSFVPSSDAAIPPDVRISGNPPTSPVATAKAASLQAGAPLRSRYVAPRPHRSRQEGGGHRIALFTGNFLHVVDGVSRTLNRLVRYLEEQGFHVLVFGPTDQRTLGDEMERFVPIASLPLPGRPEYRLSMGLSRAARKRLVAFAPHLVHIATPDLLGLHALQWARTRALPVVATYHTHFPTYLRFYHLGGFKRALERYLRWFYRQCLHVYVPTTPLMGYFEGLGVTGNLKLWGRGVDTQWYNPSWRSISWRSERNLEPTDVLVTFVGRLVREKRLDLFAAVIEGLRERGVAARSMVVGEGPLRTSLEARLSGTLFTGHLEGPALARAYASSDIFLFPSDSEAFGNVIVEAMASGLPVVCAGLSGSSHHVVHGETGLLAPPGDPCAFLDHVQTLVLLRELRLNMGRSACARASRYAWEPTLNAMSRYYKEALASTLDPPEHESSAYPVRFKRPEKSSGFERVTW